MAGGLLDVLLGTEAGPYCALCGLLLGFFAADAIYRGFARAGAIFGLLLFLVGCGVLGALVAAAMAKPGADGTLPFLPYYLGTMAGGFVGLVLIAAVGLVIALRLRRMDPPGTHSERVQRAVARGKAVAAFFGEGQRWRLQLLGGGLAVLCYALVYFLAQPPALREVRRFEGHHIAVTHLAISADGRRLLCTGYPKFGAGADHLIVVWDGQTGQELRRIDGREEVWALAIAADGRRALTGGPTALRLWDVETGQLLREMTGNDKEDHAGLAVSVLALSPDGQQALTGDKGGVRLWDLTTGKPLRRLDAAGQVVESVAFAPDGSRVAAGSGEVHPAPPPARPGDAFVQVWDAKGRELHRFQTGTVPANCLAFSPDSQRLLAAGGGIEPTARVWDVNSGREVQVFRGKVGFAAAGFSADGRQALCLDAHWAVWDVTRGKEIARARGQNGAVGNCAAFTADGRHVVFANLAGDFRKMQLWELPR
jgi:sugar lactone lactonase YvrE